MALAILFCIFIGFCNCARGRLLFNMTTSTEISRIIATFFMALATAVLAINARPGNAPFVGAVNAWTWLTLLIWCTPAWDVYWSAEIGNDPVHSRWWGLGMMTLRMTLAAPCILGLAWYSGHSYLPALGVLTLGLPYFISGYVSPVKYVISAAETVVGIILGAMIFSVIS